MTIALHIRGQQESLRHQLAKDLQRSGPVQRPYRLGNANATAEAIDQSHESLARRSLELQSLVDAYR
jgi:hypothetical protein